MVNLNKVDVELLEQVVEVVGAVVLVVVVGTTFHMVNTMTEWEVQTTGTRNMSGISSSSQLPISPCSTSSVNIIIIGKAVT